jgi:tetratricopeptide (TPR) repeat protein
MKTKDRLAVFEKAEGAALPEATRRTGLAEALIEAERFDEAIVEFDKAAKLAPESTRIAIGGAEALFLAGRYDDAVAAFAPLVQKAPLSARAAIGQTTALLFSGRTPEAHRAAADAEARGVRSIRLAAIGKRLSKAARGPEWTKRETVRTEHYEIVSDLDRSTCDEAGRVLEESYAAYGRLLGRPKIRGSAKARVYLFSGKAGYERYAQDALGGAPSHTAGLYSPEVKQLLIWNLETRDLMMRTVRHEGFHQYCDRMWRDAPLWLNEGLAEYFETVRIVNGSWSTGEKRKDHLDALASLERLSDYFSRDAAKFYAEPERSYAQAWALVHFMLHGGPEPRKAFDRLKASLDQGHSAARAIEDALPPEVFSTFEAEFRGHVATLRS